MAREDLITFLRLTRSRLGMIVMAAATIDDRIGWSLFAVILSKVSPMGMQGERSLTGTLLQGALPFGEAAAGVGI